MKGIPFTPDNQKVIRDKLKTQTRRLSGLKEINKEPDIWHIKTYPDGSWLFENNAGDFIDIKPRYQVGETVYIKEAWEIETVDYPMAEINYVADEYGNDSHDVCIVDKKLPTNLDKVQSPFFMPEWAARDFIKITDVRPERLQSITPEDCIAEGIFVRYQSAYESLSTDYRSPTELIKNYQVLWDSISKAYPYDGNYWVWRICFNLINKED